MHFETPDDAGNEQRGILGGASLRLIRSSTLARMRLAKPQIEISNTPITPYAQLSLVARYTNTAVLNSATKQPDHSLFSTAGVIVRHEV